MTTSRRRFLQTLASGTALLAASVPAAMLTPRQSAGPFYPNLPLLDDDNDLTRVPGSDRVAQGQHCDLSGRLLDRNGNPLKDTRIEIWQCDANGRYRHSRDPRKAPMDPAFQGFGYASSNAEGRYRFRTIRPVPYPGRTPHIHVAVYPPGEQRFVTQLYVAGEPRNTDDFLYRRIPTEQRHLVTAAFEDAGNGMLHADWDLIIGTG